MPKDVFQARNLPIVCPVGSDTLAVLGGLAKGIYLKDATFLDTKTYMVETKCYSKLGFCSSYNPAVKVGNDIFTLATGETGQYNRNYLFV